MLDGGEAFDRTAGDALRRRIRRDEIRMLGLEPLELVQQPIELLVGDLRIVVNVVALFVMADLLRGARLMRASGSIGAIGSRRIDCRLCDAMRLAIDRVTRT